MACQKSPGDCAPTFYQLTGLGKGRAESPERRIRRWAAGIVKWAVRPERRSLLSAAVNTRLLLGALGASRSRDLGRPCCRRRSFVCGLLVNRSRGGDEVRLSATAEDRVRVARASRPAGGPVAVNDVGWDPAAAADLQALFLSPGTDSLRIDVRATWRPRAAGAATASAALAGLPSRRSHVLVQSLAQGSRVLGVEVDLVAGAIKSESDRLLRRGTIEIVDQGDGDLLSHTSERYAGCAHPAADALDRGIPRRWPDGSEAVSPTRAGVCVLVGCRSSSAPWSSSWFQETGVVMNDDGCVAALRVGRLMDTLALALVDMEPVLGTGDRQDLRELVMLLGWWSGRLAGCAEAQDGARTGGTVR